MYFYELHEADDDIFSDVLLAHDVEFDEAQFLEMVLEAREQLISSFEEDSLVEAIAKQLQKRHDFLYVDDSRLRVSVLVSANEGETKVTEVDERAAARAAEAEDEDFRSMLIEADPEDRLYN